MTSTNAAPSSPPDALRLPHQEVPDAALAHARVDDERHHPDDAIGVLEPRQGVEGDEAENLALEVGDDDARVGRGEPLEPLDDVRRTGRVALVGEEARDPLGVVVRRRPEDDALALDHRLDGTRWPLDEDRDGPDAGKAAAITEGPNGPVSERAIGPRDTRRASPLHAA